MQVRDFKIELLPPAPNLAVVAENSLWNELSKLDVADSTRDKYVKAIEHFCQFAYQSSATPEMIAKFLSLDRYGALELVFAYRRDSIDRQLSPSTFNLRLAALKSLVDLARKLGKTTIDLSDCKSLAVVPYRDTKGISPADFSKLLQQVDRDSVGGARDYAILRLIWDHALRRIEIQRSNVVDLRVRDRQLLIVGKGRRVQEPIDLSDGALSALSDWIDCYPATASDASDRVVSRPLFISLSRNSFAKRISGKSIYDIVRGYAEAAGLERVFSPHRGRHSALTALLDAGASRREAQAVSRHIDGRTLDRYDDNRQQVQKVGSARLDGLLDPLSDR
jgi:integrase/recombinase XerC